MLLFSLAEEQNTLTENAELEALITAVSAGDNAAMEQLYLRTRTAIYGYSLSILKNPHDAEDVLHDCLIAVKNGAEKYRAQGKPMAWLMTVARNLCFGLLRERRKTEAADPDGEIPDFAESTAMSPEDKVILKACMEQLSDEERQIITLHAVSGFRHREIAAITKLPLSTVLSKYHRAVKRLRKHLQN